jgi:hypothetical protein
MAPTIKQRPGYTEKCSAINGIVKEGLGGKPTGDAVRKDVLEILLKEDFPIWYRKRADAVLAMIANLKLVSSVPDLFYPSREHTMKDSVSIGSLLEAYEKALEYLNAMHKVWSEDIVHQFVPPKKE